MFLLKVPYLEYLSSLFTCPDHMSIQTDIVSYCKAVIKDARNATVQLKKTNTYQISRLLYHKVYNLHKKLFATFLISAEVFPNTQLEVLAYFQELLDRRYQINYISIEGPYQAKHN